MRIYGRRFHGCRVEEYLWHGHTLVVMENELLRVSVVTSKGADILEFRYKPRDLDVFWHAPQPLLPPGQHIPTIASKFGSFLDHFTGGWQEVFPSGGLPTEYKGVEFGVHGEVSLLPWDVSVREDSSSRIEIKFTVETIRTPFRLERTLVMTSRSPVLNIEESVTNLGEEDLAFMWGHHPSFGSPFLEEGCLIEMPPCDVSVPEYAAKLNRRLALNSVSKYPYSRNLKGELEPIDIVKGRESRTEDNLVFSNFEEGWYALRNPRQGLAVGLVWQPSVFPFLWGWQLYGGRWGYPHFGRGFVLALEPFNCPILTLAECVNQGCAPVLGGGKVLTSRMEAGIFEVPSKISRLSFDGLVAL
jgi:galactose mutarotase-like enzyme